MENKDQQQWLTQHVLKEQTDLFHHSQSKNSWKLNMQFLSLSRLQFVDRKICVLERLGSEKELDGSMLQKRKKASIKNSSSLCRLDPFLDREIREL